MLRAGALLSCLAALGACAGPGALRNSATPTAQWLVGGWVLQGDSCSSDAGVIYRPDGSWSSYETAGRWQLQGSKLVTTITADGGQEPTGTAVPRQIVEKIDVVGPNTFVASPGSGAKKILVRCPAS
jgi:hypothetical protein